MDSTLSIIAIIISSLSLLVHFMQFYVKYIKHRCDAPPHSPDDLLYYAGRKTLIVDGKKMKVCIWRQAVCTSSVNDKGFGTYHDTITFCVCCNTHKIVKPDDISAKDMLIMASDKWWKDFFIKDSHR